MELTNLSREEKKAYDLEQIDALVQKIKAWQRQRIFSPWGLTTDAFCNF